MKAQKVIQGTLGIMANVGADLIVFNIIKAVMPAKIHIVAKVCVYVGGFVLGGIVGNAAEKHVDDLFEGIENIQLAIFGYFQQEIEVKREA